MKHFFKRLLIRIKERHLNHKHYKLLEKSHLFDEDWYTSTYPEVSSLHFDPIVHYLKIGFKEGKDPSSEFSSCAYLEANLDVKESAINPLVHYLKYGQFEQRKFKIDSKEVNIATPVFQDLDFNDFFRSCSTSIHQPKKILDKPRVYHQEYITKYLSNPNGYLFTSRFIDNLFLLDSWFVSSQRLRCRFSNTGDGSSYSFFVYQWEDKASPARLCLSTVINPTKLFLCDLLLANQMMPLLFIVEDNESGVREQKILLLPSLLRGGIHGFESNENYTTNGCNSRIKLNNYYSQKIFKLKSAPFLVGLAVDVSKVIGSETLLAPFFMHWLREIFSIVLLPVNFNGSRSSEVNNYIQSIFDPNTNCSAFLPQEVDGLAVPLIEELISISVNFLETQNAVY